MKKFLSLILAVLMLVPLFAQMQVGAAGSTITLEQVKKVYPNMGYVDTYYYGGKEAYGDSSKAYTCYYLENSITSTGICFFKNNALVTDEKTIKDLTAAYYANNAKNFCYAEAFEPFEGGLAETAVKYTNLKVYLEVSKYIVATGVNFLLTKDIAASIKEATDSTLSGLATDISATVLKGCNIFMGDVASDGLDAWKYLNNHKSASYVKTTSGAKDIANKIDIMYKSGNILCILTPDLIIEDSDMNALAYLESVGETVMNSVVENAFEDNDKLIKFAKEIFDGTDIIAACSSYLSALDTFPMIQTAFKIYKSAPRSNEIGQLVFSNCEHIANSVNSGSATPSTPDNAVGSMSSSSGKGTYTTDEQVVITWTKATNAVRYGLTIVNIATGKRVVDSSNFTGTSYTVGKLPAGTYRFNMRGYNAKGGAGPLSIIKEFSVVNSGSVTANYTTGTYRPSASDGLNIRSGASTSYSVLGAIAYGTSFTVTKVSGNWGYTTSGGKTGWVCLDYATYVSSSSTSGDSAGSYDAAKALQYAEAHWNTDASQLCAEFVSNCLKAGGVTSAWSRGCTSLIGQLERSGLGTKQKLNVNANGTITVSKNASILSPGDVIFVYSTGCTTAGGGDGYPYVHVYMYSGADGSGYAAGYAHNNALKGRICVYFTCAYCNKTTDAAYVFHMNQTSKPTQSYRLDVNGHVDGKYLENLSGYVTFDVYINGSRVADDVADFCTAYPEGTKFEIKDIKAAKGYVLVSGGPYTGTISGGQMNVDLTLQSEPATGTWSEWMTAKPESKDGRTIESKKQYGYYHYVHKWTDTGFVGAYPVKDYRSFTNDPTDELKYHEYWSDSELTKTGSWTDGTTTYVAYTNKCCNLGNNVSTTARDLYSLGKTRTVYRFKDAAPHKHAYTETVTKPATCGAAGVKTFRCACGDVIPRQSRQPASIRQERRASPRRPLVPRPAHA